jgi:hypothetical protein
VDDALAVVVVQANVGAADVWDEVGAGTAE